MVDPQEETRNADLPSSLDITSIPIEEKNEALPINNGEPTVDSCNTPPIKQGNPIFERIQRDLNSPSANVRMRALKALKSPTKATAYTHFDVPHEEQSIITAEERKTPPPPPTLAELMRDVLVYVEVRSDEDNRTAGVKKVISALGARVNDKLLRDTTHVIFKDGLLSSYKKAKLWNIPVVSILWIEACKNKKKICDPSDFPISNIDRYENPELYEKLKRHKQMQPDSECNKRVRPKIVMSKAIPTTPKTRLNDAAGLKRTPRINGAIRDLAGSKKKTEISHYFKQVDVIGENGSVVSEEDLVADKEKLLNRSNCLTPVSSVTLRKKTQIKCILSGDETNNDGVEVATRFAKDAIKPVNYETVEENHKKANDTETTLESTINSLRRVSLSQVSNKNLCNAASASNLNHTPKSKKSSHRVTASSAENSVRNVLFAFGEEKSTTTSSKIDSNCMETSKHVNKPRRRTTYSKKSLDISTATPVTTNKKPNNRRTLYSHVDIEEEIQQKQIDVIPDQSKTTTLLPPLKQLSNCLNVCGPEPIAASSIQLEGYDTPKRPDVQHVFSSTRKPGNRRTMFDVSMDIITQRLENINKSVRRRNSVEDNVTTSSLQNLSKVLECTDTLNGIELTNDSNTKSIYVPDSIAAGDAVELGITKKRKLFHPNDSNLTPPALVSKSIQLSNAKRRRTLMPILPVDSAAKTASVTPRSNIKKNTNYRRRSTMDFEIAPQSSKKQTPKKPSNAVSETGVLAASHVAKARREVQTKMPLGKIVDRIKLPFLVCTNMHQDQIEVIRKAIEVLGGFQLAHFVSSETSHVVSFEVRRTLNLLRALSRGLWILEYKWVLDSMQAGQWLNEEQYELRDFSRAVEICRAERQAFGNTYKCELFADLGSFYISARCGPINKDNLKELIVLCGGKIVDQRKRARYILGDENRPHDDKIYVTPYWILDSITLMQVQKCHKYQNVAKPSKDENFICQSQC